MTLPCYDVAMSPKGQPLTDEQYAAIAWADPSESTLALSQRLGVAYETVRVNRQRIAHAGGWWCALVVSTCAACGHPLLTPTTVRGPARLRHAACQRARHRLQAQVRSQRAAQHRRAQRRLTALQAVDRQDVAQTGPAAFRDHAPWSADEDARLLEMLELSAQDLAAELGRSPASIYMRRSRLRRHLK